MSSERPFRQAIKNVLRPYPGLVAFGRAAVYAVRDFYSGTIGRLLAAKPQDYLKDAEEPKLHLGCADIFLPGWLNTDAYPRRRAVTIAT